MDRKGTECRINLLHDPVIPRVRALGLLFQKLTLSKEEHLSDVTSYNNGSRMNLALTKAPQSHTFKTKESRFLVNNDCLSLIRLIVLARSIHARMVSKKVEAENTTSSTGVGTLWRHVQIFYFFQSQVLSWKETKRMVHSSFHRLGFVKWKMQPISDFFLLFFARFIHSFLHSFFILLFLENPFLPAQSYYWYRTEVVISL